MSSSKLKRDIQLLEKQLEKIDINISDPIERIEQKKQLEREIKKLERSKSQIEQLEQEQQELESLKSEFTLNSNELVDERKSTQDKQIEHTASVVDISMAVEPEINLSKQREDSQNSQVIKTNHSEKNSDLTPVTPSSNNSKELGKAWVIGGMIGFFIFLGLIINGHQVNQTSSNIEQQTSESVEVEKSSDESLSSTQTYQLTDLSKKVEKSSDESLPSTETYQPTDLSNFETENASQSIPSFTQQEAVNLLERWQNAKSQIFAPPFNRELGAELLTGKSYYDNIGNPEGSVAWLQDNASYYTYDLQSIDSIENFAVNEDYATIEVIVTEQRTLYNQYGNIDRNASGFDTRLVRYNLESENGQWKIADYQTIKKIK
jgi:ARC6-like, IMS domain